MGLAVSDLGEYEAFCSRGGSRADTERAWFARGAPNVAGHLDESLMESNRAAPEAPPDQTID
jgi:hypothetical protein